MSSGSHDRFTFVSGGILTVLAVLCLITVFMMGESRPTSETAEPIAAEPPPPALVELPPDIVTPVVRYQSEKTEGSMNPFFTEYFVPKTNPKPKPKPPPETVQIPVVFQGLVKLAEGKTIVYLLVNGALTTTSPGETVQPGWKLAEANADAIVFDGGEGRSTRVGFRETAQLEIPRPQE